MASFGSSAIGAIGAQQTAKQQNEQRRRDYEYRLKVRENKWMREKTLYKTKIVNYQTNVSEANIAAQRAYTQSQINLNNVRQQAIFDHQEDFSEMLKAEGALEVSAAERGSRGGSVNRLIAMNLQKYGTANARRVHALTMTEDRYKEHVEGVARQQKSQLNSLFGKVAISPVPDVEPPAPVMTNPNAQLFLGLAGAAFDAGTSYLQNKQEQKWWEELNNG